jgi:3-methyladenine DNA glycosylase AlkC
LDTALKNMFNEQSVGALADAMVAEYAAFHRDVFVARVFEGEWANLELKARMRHITTILHDYLPDDYRTSLRVLRGALLRLGDFGFEKMVFPDYVEVYGLDDWEASIAALEEFTQHVSAEFAIRPFIARYQDRTMAKMLEWTGHEHPSVRRLASEGCRPRLPWAMALPALKADPSPILPILDRLRQDGSESVRRSVANNLNDISKDNPSVVIALLQRWRADDGDEVRAVMSHALRTLLKQGDPDALALLGYASDPDIAVRNVSVEPDVVSMGGSVTFSFDVESLGDGPQNLMIDFVVHFVKANGKSSPKVFKLSKKTLQLGQALQVNKKVSFAPITTRKYYPGEHAIQPKINGKLFQSVSFRLSESRA